MVHATPPDDVMQARFTLVLCHLDKAPVIAERIANKLEALGPFPRAGFLLIDNGSRDGSTAIFADLARREPRFHWCEETRRGIYFVRRRAIMEAKGDYLIMVDDDVSLSTQDLVELLEPLVQRHDVGLVGARVRLESKRAIPAWAHPKMLNQFATDIAFDPGARYSTSQFPCFPTGIAKALRLGPESALYCEEPRASDQALGRRRADPALGIEAQDLGGEDQDLAEIYARNGWLVLFANQTKMTIDVPDERLAPAWFQDRFEADGRTRIRLLRRTGRKPWSRHGIRFLLGLFPFGLLNVIGPLLPPRQRLWAACYFAKALGAWKEFLTGPHDPPWPYLTRKDRA